jgi:hypothetical protein
VKGKISIDNRETSKTKLSNFVKMSFLKILIYFLIVLQVSFTMEIQFECVYKYADNNAQLCQISGGERIPSNLKKISFYTYSGYNGLTEDGFGVDEKEVRKIWIYYTPMKVLVPRIFSEIVRTFPKIEIIRIHVSLIQVIKPGTFQTPSQLSQISFLHNNIETVRNGTFDGLEKTLIYAKIYACKTKHIESGVFTDLKKLEVLILTGNELTSLEKNLFANLGELRTLGLSRNKFKVLHHGYFRKNFKLDNIKFGGNQIEAISPKFFAGVFMPTLISFRYNPCNYRNETFNSQSDALDGLQICIENYREKYSKGSKMKISSFWLLFSLLIVAKTM